MPPSVLHRVPRNTGPPPVRGCRDWPWPAPGRPRAGRPPWRAPSAAGQRPLAPSWRPWANAPVYPGPTYRAPTCQALICQAPICQALICQALICQALICQALICRRGPGHSRKSSRRSCDADDVSYRSARTGTRPDPASDARRRRTARAQHFPGGELPPGMDRSRRDTVPGPREARASGPPWPCFRPRRLGPGPRSGRPAGSPSSPCTTSRWCTTT